MLLRIGKREAGTAVYIPSGVAMAMGKNKL